MKIIKVAGNDCGGFKPPKGHLDTQMFPECEDYETDRNIVKKTVERRGKKQKKEAKNSFPIVREKPTQSIGVWEQWQQKEINDKQFVEIIMELSAHQGLAGVSKDPTVRNGIRKAIENFKKTRDLPEAARSISAFLTMGKNVDESHFATTSGNWYKKAQMEGDEPSNIKMKRLSPNLKEKIAKYFREKFPNASASFEDMYKWFTKYIMQNPKVRYDWEEHQKRDLERAIKSIPKS